MLDLICDKKLPIVLEETFDRTVKFIDQVAGRTPVIIPHLGLLNGGFETLFAAGVWDNPSVFADTALAGSSEISIFLDSYGSERLIFGSDFPFGMPAPQLNRLLQSGTPQRDLENICSKNIARLLRIR